MNELVKSDVRYRVLRCNSSLNRNDKDYMWRDVDGIPTLELLVADLYPEGTEFTASVNGKVIAKADYAATVLKPWDSVLVVPTLHGSGGAGQILAIVAMVIITVLSYGAGSMLAGAMGLTTTTASGATALTLGGQIVAGLVAAVGSYAGGLLVNAVFGPDAPGQQRQSQAYAWNPVNTQQQGLPLPYWYGECVVKSSNIIGAYRTADSASKNIINALMHFGLGPLEAIYDVKINDQPISNYSRVTATARLGMINQDPIPGFDDTIVEYSHSVLLPPKEEGGATTPVVYTTLFDDADAIEFDLVAPAGIYRTNSEGRRRPLEMDIRVEMRPVGGAWVTLSHSVDTYMMTPVTIAHWSRGYWTGGTWSENTVEGATWVEVEDGGTNPTAHVEGELGADIVMGVAPDTWLTTTVWRWRQANDLPEQQVTTEVDYYHWNGILKSYTVVPLRYPLTGDFAGQFLEIRVTRLTIDRASPTEDVYFGSVKAIYVNDFEYPRQALLGVTAVASDQISGGFACEARVKGRKVFVYHGSAGWTFEYSTNPAWICLDILAQPVVQDGATDLSDIARFDGIDVNRIDYDSFIEWADFCDELVPDGNSGMEKRFEFNGGIDYQTTVWEAAMKISEMSRATLIWHGNKIKVVVDKPSTPTQLFTVGNQSINSFTETFLPESDRASVIEVSFNNIANNYDRDQLIVYNSNLTNSSARVSLQPLGVVKRSTAWRIARYLLNKNQYIKRAIQFEADVDAIACTVGDVIYIQSDSTLWGDGGRLVSGTTTEVVLDKKVHTVPGHTYSIMIRYSDDTLVTRNLVTPVAEGDYDTFTLASALSQAPSQYDVYSFGEGEDHIRQYRISSIGITGDQSVTINAIEYNSSVYNDDSSVPDYTSIVEYSKLIPVVTNLAAVEVIEVDDAGVSHRNIEVTWTNPISDEYGGANVWIVRDFDGIFNWELLGTTTGNSWTITDVDPNTTYLIAVQSLDKFGNFNSLNSSPRVEITTGGFDIGVLTGQYRPNLIYNPIGALDYYAWTQGGGAPGTWPGLAADARGHYWDVSYDGVSPISYTLVSDYISIEGGVPITLSGQIDSSGLIEGSIHLDVQYYDVNHVYLSEGPEISTATAHDWEFQEATQQTPANAAYVKARIFVTNFRGTSCGVRECKLEYGSYATPFTDPSVVPTVGAPTGTYVGTMAALDVATAATNFNTRNDRNGDPITPDPVFPNDGTAIDHTLNTDGSCNVSIEWTWAGDDTTIDGWGVLAYAKPKADTTPYVFGTDPAHEYVFRSPAHIRAWIFYGVPADMNYSIALFAYRTVDPDVNANRIIVSTVVYPTYTGEYPYLPENNVAFDGDITGTINGTLQADQVNVYDFVSGVPTEVQTTEVWTTFERTGLFTFNSMTDVSVEEGDGVSGGNYLRLGNNSGDDYRRFVGKRLIPYDPSKLYRVSVRARQPSGTGSFYCGLAGVGADGTTYVNTVGANSLDSQHFCTASNRDLGATWEVLIGYLKGTGTADTAEHPGIAAPGVMHANVKYVTPIVVANAPSNAGITDIDEISVHVLDPMTVGAPEGTYVGTSAALDVSNTTINFNDRNDRIATAVVDPSIPTISHTENPDGSINIKATWTWSGNEFDIDGFAVYGYMSDADAAYTFGTTPASEYIFQLLPNKREWQFQGLPATKFYTIGILAYRIVDPDINANGIMVSAIKQAARYRPRTTVAIGGSDTTTPVVVGGEATVLRTFDKYTNYTYCGKWVDATYYRSQGSRVDVIHGSDNKLYYCKASHTSAAATKPITGGSYATYWGVLTVTQLGYTPNWKGAWALSTAYASSATQKDIVIIGDVALVCILSHTSDAAKTPFSGADWRTYWRLFNGGLYADGLGNISLTGSRLVLGTPGLVSCIFPAIEDTDAGEIKFYYGAISDKNVIASIGVSDFLNETSFSEFGSTTISGVYGFKGVIGKSSSWYGGHFTSTSDVGVWAETTTGVNAVYGSNVNAVVINPEVNAAISGFSYRTDTTAHGVYGEAGYGTSAYGGYFISASGNGLYGQGGTNKHGVVGVGNGNGYGGHFTAGATGYGVYGVTSGTSYAGVFGAGGANSVGVYGTSSKASVGAVYGLNSATGGYGVYGSASGTSGTCIGGAFSATSSTGGIGCYATGSAWDFYAEGDTAGYNVFGSGSYGPFTGAHDGLVELAFVGEPGDILVDVRLFNKKNLSNAITVMALSNSTKQKSAAGVLINVFDLDPMNAGTSVPYPWEEDYSQSYKAVVFNAVGEGVIAVCKDGGDIEIGDYICTSNRPGKGMKQDDDLLHNYTVAKAREAVQWGPDDDSIKLIACSYHSC